MQASDRILAQRYSRALFLAAAEKGQEAAVLEELGLAQRKLMDLASVLKHPRVSAAEKKRRIGEALGPKVSPLVRRFLELLVDKKRFSVFSMAMMALGRFVAEKKNTARAHVRTARALGPEARQALADSLKKFSGKNVELDVHVDPEVIGGAVVRLGDWVLDGSLRSQLKRLGRQLGGEL